MKKITHEGKEYEVLPLDRISEITHAKLAGGKVVGTLPRDDGHFVKVKLDIAYHDFFYAELTPLGIQPLKLLPKKPVEFVGTIEPTFHGSDRMLVGVPDSLPVGMKLRCVEVTE